MVGAISISSIAQNIVKGVQWDKKSPTTLQLINIEANTGIMKDVVATIALEGNEYVPNTFHHDAGNDLIFFMAHVSSGNPIGSHGQVLIIARASTGAVLKKLSLTNAMAPFIISERNEIGFIGVQRESHGYGNNDDDISLKVFNMNTGKTTATVDLNNLSFMAVAAPFSGKPSTQNGTKGNTAVSLSSTCFIGSTGELVFCAKDVMGINRLMKIDLSTGKLASSSMMQEDVLDIAFDPKTGKLLALYLESEEGGHAKLKLGELNLNSGNLSNGVLIRNIGSYEFPVTDGSIKMNGDIVVVRKVNPAGKLEIYAMDGELKNISLTVHNDGSKMVDFEFPYVGSSIRNPALNNMVKLYPNPSHGVVTVASDEKATVTRVIIRNEVGQVIQDVRVESGTQVNEIDISALAVGLYLVEIETDLTTPVVQKLMVR